MAGRAHGGKANDKREGRVGAPGQAGPREHLVKGMKGTMVCLFPSGREAHEEPALDLCAEAELRRTGVDSGSHENACLSPVGVQLTDTP